MKHVFVHGFLGLLSDWQPTLQLPEANYISIWESIEAIQDNVSFSSWADHFLQTTPKGIRAFGYSLGGRLLLHAFQKDPEHFESLYLVSTHFGLTSISESASRLENDQKWASRFLTEDWKRVVSDWNAQPVFKDSFEPQRQEADFNRQLLAIALDQFSLGRQENLLSVIQYAARPIHYVVGEKDQKFTLLAAKIQPTENVSTHILPGVGHRILWDPNATLQLQNLIKTN